ncbi:MAG: DUF6036 family nucleotidyltransferase [Thermoplasmata archaeon]
MIYEDVLREFELKKVKYLVVGGIAVNLYGYVRITMDMDIMVDLSEKNLSKVMDVMEKLGYSPRVPVNPEEFILKKNRDKWIKGKNAVVFTFIDMKNPYKHIDIFLNNPIDFSKAYLRKEVMVIGGIKVFVASIEDIIKLKSIAGRPRDKEDIIHLKKIKKMKKK